MVTKIRKGARPHIYLAEWMEFRGLDDARLAGRLGVARETVTRWRGEQRLLNTEKLAAIASALDCEPSQLWHPPDRTSIDAILAGAPKDLVEDAADIVRRLVRRAG